MERRARGKRAEGKGSGNGRSGLGSIGRVSRTVSDIDASVAWYRDVLGLPFLFGMEKMAFFDCGGTRLYLDQHQDQPKPESILYFKVADIHAARGALEAKGVTFLNAPHMIGRQPDGTEEWMVFFNDRGWTPAGADVTSESVTDPHADYLAKLDPEVRDRLATIRAVAERRVPGAERCIAYQMPALRKGRVFFYFAAFRKHIGIYPPVL